MAYITIGGKNTYKKGDHVSHNIKRLKIWNEKTDDEKKFAISAFGDDADKLLKIKNTDEILSFLIKKWKIDQTCHFSYGYLHNTIVKYYLYIIDNCDNKPDGFIEENKEELPSNYTPEMTRLVGIKWDNFDNTLKGFCPCEPLVRLTQLVKFPIHLFYNKEKNYNILKIKPLIKPQHDIKMSENIYDTILSLEPVLKQYEALYMEAASLISDCIITLILEINKQ